MIDAIKNRKSVRKFKSDAVPSSKLNSILEAAQIAPSGSNTQPWKFIIVQSRETIEKLSDVSKNQSWMRTAPMHIVAVADISSRIKDSEHLSLDETSSIFELKQVIRDTVFSIENILLEATNQGLDTCVVADFTQEGVRPVLNIPKDKFVVAIITLGYADLKNGTPHNRHPLEDMVYYEKWNNLKEI